MRDSINLTAAMINPPGNVSGDVDATGCNIGIYYSPGAHGQVQNANIHGANYFGIVNNGGEVKVEKSTISDIGEKPLNGDQHGVGIYWAYNSGAKGDIRGNTIWNYQKAGIVVHGPNSTSNIQYNTVIGQGPVNYIAQNGIEAGYGAANVHIQQNVVYGNSYTGPNEASSGGILVFGGACYVESPTYPTSPTTTNVLVQQNTGLGNDVGVWFSNLAAGCVNEVSTPTNDTALNNTLVNNDINNTTGNGPTPPPSGPIEGYQAGISDQGDMDVIQNNFICGPGYTSPSTASVVIFPIDTTSAMNANVQNNGICSVSSFWGGGQGAALAHSGHSVKPSRF